MKKTNADYVREWRQRNKHKTAEYNKRYLENLKKKAVEEYKKENNENINSL